jgi:DNA mismatch repair protein MutS2
MGRDPTPVRTQSNTVDLRGMRVDEAEDRVEAFIDRLLSEGEPAGFVLHGHGTGALKSAIRDHLAAHRFVARARPADEEDGGDAFTVFWLT